MKIAMLLSGGVDSSVALALLRQNKQNKITAFYIKIWMEDKFSFLGKCPWSEDLKYAEAVCGKLKVPLRIVNLQKEYWQKVVSQAIDEIKDGRTPNPDFMCNNLIKFGAFYDYFGCQFDKIASGHYGQVEDAPKGAVKSRKDMKLLKRSPDAIKDQTYFLAGLNQEQLGKIIFPIGHLTKKDVRRLAEKFNLPNKERRDSQGICFLGKIKYSDFIREHLSVKKGKIINVKNNKELGEHEGYWFFTIGQRQGIKLPGGPWYVVKKDIGKNIIYVADKTKVAGKARRLFMVDKLRWLSGQPPRKKNLSVKIRHGENFYKCQVKFVKGRMEVKLNKTDKGIAAGQYAVFYDGEYCLGGGRIQ